MKKSLLVILPLSLIVLSGCAHYSHSRDLAEGRKETTSFTSFLMMGKASSIRSAIKDTNYSRTVSVGSLEGQTESEKLALLIEAVANGVAAGLKK